MNKKFIITIDTEGDNLWDWKNGDKINTENTLYLQRFQDLCNEFCFKPTWLTNYEMLKDHRYLKFAYSVEEKQIGEIGMHLHAWSTPPEHALPIKKNGAPYLIEYPIDVMEEKVSVMTEEIQNSLGVKPASHRAGRWAMNDAYFHILNKYGYKVDCSVTPGINWHDNEGQSENSHGTDYSAYPSRPYIVEGTSVLEIPVTILKSKRIFLPEHISVKNIAKSCYRATKGQSLWLRPNGRNLKQMLYLSDQIVRSDSDYLMFMLHSSEFMPGGSPTFKDSDAIEKLYNDLRILFAHISENYYGCTLREYEENLRNGNT